MVRAFLMMALVVLLAGCYRNVPAPLGAVSLGSDVVVRLTAQGIQRVEESTGVRRGELIGQLLQRAEEVTVSVPLILQSGMRSRGLRQEISVNADEVVSVNMRELDRGRTAIIVGGLAVAVGTMIVATVVNIIGGSAGAGRPQGGDGSQQPALLNGFH